MTTDDPVHEDATVTLPTSSVTEDVSPRRAVAGRRTNSEAAIRLLRSWREGDDQEQERQRQTWEYLQRVLDEDRLSSRKLFP